MPVERESKVPEDPVDAFVQRATNGSKGGAKILADMLRADPGNVPRVVALLGHEKPNVKAGAAEALADVAPIHAPVLAEFVPQFLTALQKGTADARTAGAVLKGLAEVVALRPDALDGEGLAALEYLLGRRPKPELLEVLYLVLGRWAGTSPERAGLILPLLSRALSAKPREPVAKALIMACGDIARGPGGAERRQSIRDVIANLRGHPSPLVRERAAKLIAEIDRLEPAA